MKKLLTATLALFAFANLQAQSFSEGDKFISLGYGAPNLGKSVLNTYQNEDQYSVAGFGPLHAKFEYAVSDKIGLGISVNHVNFAANWVDNANSIIGTTYDYKYVRNSTAFNARLNFHFGNTDKMDPYFGFGFGYKHTTNKWTTNEPNFEDISVGNLFPLGFETTIGIRAYFTPVIGAYAEVGVAKSIIQAGLVIKL